MRSNHPDTFGLRGNYSGLCYSGTDTLSSSVAVEFTTVPYTSLTDCRNSQAPNFDSKYRSETTYVDSEKICDTQQHPQANDHCCNDNTLRSQHRMLHMHYGQPL
uniref:Uncharacterized protein n=1 Tax=Ascaris lumbricoides TaxID=6252 RepID=A0A0M3HPP0_ASCLU